MYLENKEGRAAGAVRVNNMKKYFLKEAAREAHEEARRAAYKIEEAGAVFGVYGWK